jgi:hypothetical protein
MARFMTDIKGRIKNISLSESKYLWPVPGSVVNSIQSIEDSGRSDGFIEVTCNRLKCSQIELGESSGNPAFDLAPFESFTICDNGASFNEANCNSFLTSDSQLKFDKGGKGIGRFLWLKCFEKAEIESVFHEKGQWIKRKFSFDLQGVHPDENILPSEFHESRTSITLINFNKVYRNKCPKSLELLATKIIEHCLVYLVLGNCPQIVFKDNSFY